MRLCERLEQGGEVLRFEKGFVTLDVDVDVGVDELRDGVDAVSAAGQIGGGELDGPVVLLAEFGDFVGVGGDDDAVELGAGAGSFEHPGEHGPSGDVAKDFTGETGGGEAGRDDSKHVGRPLFAGCGIKYDGNWLCRGDVSHSKRSFVPA